MSTKSTIVSVENDGDHKLVVHIFKEMHESGGVVRVQLSCSTCYCAYDFLMTEHLGLQLAEIIKKGDEKE